MINHRYRVIRKLGEGASSSVFLAEDCLRGGMRCAVKVYNPAGQTGGMDDERFRNEVSLLMSLAHPNLVSVFDFGVIRKADTIALHGRRFFTMEYVEGTDALTWFDSIRGSENAGRQLEHLLLESLAVLMYLHREGVVHFDIKPQNLMLVTAGDGSQPLLKLSDFGLGERLKRGDEIPRRGTLEYTAPELLRGGVGDHRVDLYSLGATFYHLMEGRCPFEADDSIELVKMVLSEAPHPLRARDPIFSRIAVVVRKLIQKDPAERFSSADDALAELVRGSPEHRAMYARFPRKPKFVGRKEEQDRLHAAVLSLKGEVQAELPGAILVTGEDGVGKSALLRRVARFALSRGIIVLETEAVRSPLPFYSISSSVHRLSVEAQLFSPGGNALSEKYSPLLDPVILRHDDEADTLPADRRRKEEYRVESLSRFFVECSRLFPIVLIADDIHRVDDQSLQLLRTIIRDAASERLLLLVSCPAGEIPDGLPYGLWREVRLHDLGIDDIREMAGSMFGTHSAADELPEKVYELYGGSPAIVGEVLHALDETFFSDLNERGYRGTLREHLETHFPRSVEEFLVNRLSRLDQERRRMLEVISCFRHPARVDALGNLVPFGVQRTPALVRSLVLEGFLDSSEDGRRVFFRHARLKTVVYSRAGQNRLHAMIAATLERVSDPPAFIDLQEIAAQFSAGGKFECAAQYFEKAGDEGLRIGALRQSTQLYRDAIAAAEQSGDSRGVPALQTKLANALLQEGSFHEAMEASRRLLDRRSEASAERPTLLKIAGRSEARLGEHDQARKHITEALALTTDQVQRIELNQELIGMEIALGNYQVSEQASMKQLHAAKELRNVRLVSTIHTDLGIATFFQGRHDDAVSHFREAMKGYEEAKDLIRVADAMINIGNALSAKGDTAGAIEYWEDALSGIEEYGTRNQQAQVYNNLGIAYYKLKRYDRAKFFYNRSFEIFDRLNSKNGVADALFNLGEVSFVEGEYESAIERFTEVRSLYESMNESHGLVETMLQLAEVHMVFGDLESTAREITDARFLIEKKRLGTFKGQVSYLQGVLDMERGDYERALAELTAACDYFMSSGERERALLCRVRNAECRFHLGDCARAVSLCREILDGSEAKENPFVIAEASYILGTVAGTAPELVGEAPLSLYKKGLDAVSGEPVAEITWKLAYALGREFYDRGQKERAAEFFMKTGLVLRFFLSHIRSEELRRRYLSTDRREQAVKATEELVPKHA